MTVEGRLCAFYMADLAVFITADILHGVKNDRTALHFPRRVLGLSGGVGCRDIRGELARGIFGVHSLEPGDGGTLEDIYRLLDRAYRKLVVVTRDVSGARTCDETTS